jgi:starch synthase
VTILWVAAELGPEAQAGGLGEVVRALPPLLRQAGLDVRVCVPLHPGLASAPKEFRFALDLLGHHLSIHEGPHAGVPTYYIACDALFARASIYGEPGDDAYRYSVFARAAVEIGERIGAAAWHAHDWHTALVPVFAPAARTALTIHNVSYQGVVSSALVPALGLPWSVATEAGMGFGWQVVNLLKGGANAATLLSTVSETHAHDIATPEGGFGLHAIFARRRHELVGIMNGIDTVSWDPATDLALAHAFASPEGKLANRTAMRLALGLHESERPLFVSIGRLVWQKGIDLLCEAARHVPIELVIIGKGEAGVESEALALVRDFPERVRARITYDDALSRRLLAAADFFVMPSRFEPGGLAQLQAQRYGALPVVRRTGGLAESVIDAEQTGGNGVSFPDASVASLSEALTRSLALFSDRLHFTAVRARAFSARVDWRDRIPMYENFYKRLLA